MADVSAWMKRRAKMVDIRRHAKSLLYLGSVDKIMAALANEYGSDRPLPAAKVIRDMLAERRA